MRWALEIKKVPHKKVHIDLLKGEEKNPDYLSKNPAGYLPCLIVGKQAPMAESLAIMEWLEENYPAHSLFSGDGFLRARIRQLAETVNAGIQPLQNLDVVRKISSDKEAQAEWTRHWMIRGLKVYEEILATLNRDGKKFSISDQPSLADLCLIPQCYSSLRFNVDLAQFPRCKAIYEHAMATTECMASRPEAFAPAENKG